MKPFTCTEDELHHGDTVHMRKGDTLTLDDELVAYFCSMGWGTAEGVESAERTPGAQAVEIQPKGTKSE